MRVFELVLKSKTPSSLSANKQLVQALFSYVCQTLAIKTINISIVDDNLTLWFKLAEERDEKFLIDSILKTSNRVISGSLNLSDSFWQSNYVLNPYGLISGDRQGARFKCLVTGGAGFIGSNLVDGLVGLGYETVVIDNLSTGKREYLNPQAKFYEADVVDQKKMQEIFKTERFDYVFHLAAQISVADSVKEPMFDMDVNARGSFNIFHAAKEFAVKRIVFISTGGALYGDVTEPAREEMPVAPISPYAIHKFTAERYLELFRLEHNLNALTLRLANVFGPRQFKGGEGAAVAVFAHNAIHDLPSTIFGDGTKTRDFVFVGDVVSACIKAMSSNYQGVANIGTGARISVKELLNAVEKAVEKKLAYSHAEDRPGEVRDSILSIERAKQVLEWQPSVSLEDGLRQTLEWSKKQHN